MKSRLLVFTGMVVIGVGAGVRMTAQRADGSSPTFNRDVAPIIFNNCVTCHRPNQVAPMSLMSYKEVRPWSRAIKEKVSTRQMPPWFADSRFGEFKNDRRLSDEQIKTIVAWADAGAPQGETPLTAQLPTFSEDGWSHPSGRPPDLVIALANPFPVPATGEVPNFNIYQEIPDELKKDPEDHFLEAIQILPGKIAGMHHASFRIGPLPPGVKIGVGEVWPGGPVLYGGLIDIRTGKSRPDDVNRGAVGEGSAGEDDQVRVRRVFEGLTYCCYVPGGSFRQYPAGSGFRIPREGAAAWGLHYTPLGEAYADQTRVGLWYQKDLKKEIVGGGSHPGSKHIVNGKELVDDDVTPLRKTGIANAGWPALPVIPPYAKNYAITRISVFSDDMTLYTVWPHMHTRGKEMTYLLTYPDGRERVILSVPKYDFNWQLFYELKEPLKIPAGSTLKLIGSYDNSPSNKWNPAPQKEVYWSEQSWDEMFIGFTDLSYDHREPKTSQGRPSTTTGAQQQ